MHPIEQRLPFFCQPFFCQIELRGIAAILALARLVIDARNRTVGSYMLEYRVLHNGIPGFQTDSISKDAILGIGSRATCFARSRFLVH